MTADPAAAAALARAFREDAGQVLAALIARFRDFDLAEEALAEAFLRAATAWAEGPPERPGAWLLTVAQRVALDRLRATARRGREAVEQAVGDMLHPPQDEDPMPAAIPDERLRLIFTCCHPALPQEAQVALTLRTLGGLTVDEIARAFVVSPAALARRLTRAKARIRAAGIPYEVPAARELPARLGPVLEVIYLVYNESYQALDGPSVTRADLGEEALRLARLLHALLPLPETEGLLALILNHDARRPARMRGGAMVPLEAQDRGLWDRGRIEEGRARLLHALGQRRPGPYQVQAAISALHNEAPSWEATDWPQIAGLYRALEEMAPSPVVRLNRAVALLQAGDLATAGALLGDLAEPLAGYQPFFAARAEFHRQTGAPALARADLDRAIGLSRNPAERGFLAHRRDALPPGRPLN